MDIQQLGDEQLYEDYQNIIMYLNDQKGLDNLTPQQSMAIGFMMGSQDGNFNKLPKLLKIVDQNQNNNFYNNSITKQPLNNNKEQNILQNIKRSKGILDKLNDCISDIDLDQQLSIYNSKNSNKSSGSNNNNKKNKIQDKIQQKQQQQEQINEEIDLQSFKKIKKIIDEEEKRQESTPIGNQQDKLEIEFLQLQKQEENEILRKKELQKINDDQLVQQLLIKEEIERKKKIQQDLIEHEKQVQEMLEKEKMEEEKNNQISCHICFDAINDQKQLIMLEICGHMYHQQCFKLTYEDVFKQEIKKDEIKKVIGLDDKEAQVKIKGACEGFCQKQFNIFDYKIIFDDYKQIKQQNQINLFTCMLCFKQQEIEQRRVLDCNHEYCQKCIKEYIEQKYEKNEAYLCSACRKPIDELFIEDLLPQKGQDAFKADVLDALQKDRMLETALELCNGDKEQAQQIVDQGNFLELGAVTQLVPCQRNALNHVSKVAQVQSKKAIPELQKRFVKLGYPGEYVDVVLKYIRDDAPITINFKLAHLDKYIKSGYYKNLFEIQPGQNNNKHGGRFQWEQNLFNKCYDKAKPKERVKYGALNIYNDPKGIPQCQGYGQSFFVMKEVRLRTSFYDRDTGGFPQNRYLATSQHYAHILKDFQDDELNHVIEIALKIKHFESGMNKGTYKEIQIHGPVEFAKHIQFMFYNQTEAAQNPAYMGQIKEFSKKFGVTCLPIQN